jgi:hypothetical protein
MVGEADAATCYRSGQGLGVSNLTDGRTTSRPGDPLVRRGRVALGGWVERRCCVGGRGQTRCADAPVSDCEGELAEDGREPAAGVGVKSELVVAAAQVLNERMPATDRLGGAQPF